MLQELMTETSEPYTPHRLMVVDDSAIHRGCISRILEMAPNVEIVASASNGEQALKLLALNPVDTVILDLDMPVMGGLCILPQIFLIYPGIRVIVVSSLDLGQNKYGRCILKATGTENLIKPKSYTDTKACDEFKSSLLEKLLGVISPPLTESRPNGHLDTGHCSAKNSRRYPTPFMLRSTGGKKPEALSIGSSTGGPDALRMVLSGLDRNFNLPIFITQHMMDSIMPLMAEKIGCWANRPCAEAVQGEQVFSDRIYLAPGGKHMIVERVGNKRFIRLESDSPVNFCLPAVDPMLLSLVNAYDGHVLSVMLTGMGHDGLDANRNLVAAGGAVIAQDEETSIVWGMPGAVATAGLCSAVKPHHELAGEIMAMTR